MAALFIFRLNWVVFALLFLILFVPILIAIVGYSVSAPVYNGPVSDHFDGREFMTPGGAEVHGLPQVLKWMLTRKRVPWKENNDAEPGKRPLAHFNDGIRITFVNHSTFLIQADGVNILTDPVWSKRASPFSLMGPRRMRPPGIKFEDLPKIHAVMLSHNHYDHLDIPTLRLLFGAHHPRIITPLGVKKFLDNESIAGATDLDWWDEVELSGNVKVQSVPAQHFSGRGMLDRNRTLWCGYVISTTAGKIYFAGDTGYHVSIFREIANRCGTLKIAIIPIGAYKPQWFMSPVHTSPEEAVRIHQELNPGISIGCHFGTFALADEGRDEPVIDLSNALSVSRIDPEKFIVMEEGQAAVLE